jgi:putative ABC transport system permease protein
MWRATLRGLLAHKVRLGLTALAIVLGVGFVSGTYILTDTMNKAFQNLFAAVDKGIAVQVTGVSKFKGGFGGDQGTPQRVPGSLIPEIAKVPGVRVAEGEIAGYAQLITPQGKAVETHGAPTFGVAVERDKQLSGVTTVAGREPARSGEIAVDAQTAKQFGFRVGQDVTVLVQGPSVHARIVGLFGLGNGSTNLAGASIVAFDPTTAQQVLNGGGKWDSIDIAVEKGVSPSELRDRIQRILPRGFQAKTGEQTAQENADQLKKGLSFFNIALLVFAGVALFVGAFIIFNTFSILVAQRTRELGLLRALGASATQVRTSVVSEAFVTGVVASVVGLGFGLVIALGLQGLLRAFGIVLPSTSSQVLPRTVIAALIVGVVTTLVSSVLPAVRASRIPPIAAMRDAGPAEYARSRRRTAVGFAVTVVGVAALLAGLFGGHGAALVGLGAALVFLGVAILSPLLARPIARVLGAVFVPLDRAFFAVGSLVRRVFGRGERYSDVATTLATENAKRNPGRTASTAGALMIGLGLVGFVSIFAASVKASTNEALVQILKADYAVIPGSFGGANVGFSQDVAQRLRDTGDFSAVSQFRQAIFGVHGNAQQLNGVDPSTVGQVENIQMVAGSVRALAGGGLLVYQQTAESNGWHVGDTVAVQFAATGTQRLKVVGIFGDNRALGNYDVSLSTFDRNVVGPLDALVLLKVRPGVTLAEARRAAASVTRGFPNVKLQDQAQLRETQAKQIDQLLGLITALLGLAILIALFGIVNTLALSIFERTHEIGLLRAVGMSRRQVRTMIRWESVIIAVFGAILGIGVGAFFGWAMVHALRSQGITVLAFPARQLFVYVVLAGLAGVIAALFPARRAARLDVLAAITHE